MPEIFKEDANSLDLLWQDVLVLNKREENERGNTGSAGLAEIIWRMAVELYVSVCLGDGW